MAIQVHRPGHNDCGCHQCGCYDESPHSDQDISQMNFRLMSREIKRYYAEKAMIADGRDPIMMHGRARRRYIEAVL